MALGYGKKADDAHTNVLTQGAFYTEPANWFLKKFWDWATSGP
jgi:hypothetical protein